MRLFLVTSLYSFRALFHWLQPMAYVVQRALFPLVQLSFFALVGTYGGSQPLSFYLVGNVIGTATLTVFGVSQAVGDERNQGTLPYVLASPAARIPVFFGRATLHVMDGVLNMLAAVLIAVLVFGLRIPLDGLLGLGAAMLVAVITMSGLGLLMGAVAFVVLDTAVLSNLAMFILLLLTGANVPLAELPGAVAVLSGTLPLTRSIAAARLYAAGAPFADGLGLLAGDLVIAFVYGVVGYLVFSWLETRARMGGRLEGM